MPSKRTNDSVDRILEDLNIQQAQAGLRDSVTDRQVDEILRSVGITSAPAQPVPDRSPAPGADGGLDALLQQPAAAVQPAPRPGAPDPTSPRTAACASACAARAGHPAAAADAADGGEMTGSWAISGDTTRTGIIKDFLVKMAPDGSDADTVPWIRARTSSSSSATRWPSCLMKRAGCRSPARKNAAFSA